MDSELEAKQTEAQPIAECTMDDGSVELYGVIRNINTIDKTLTLVDETGDITLSFNDEDHSNVTVGDVVFVSGFSTPSDNSYAIADISYAGLPTLSAWETVNLGTWSVSPSDWKSLDSLFLLNLYDMLNMFTFERQVDVIRQGYEVYCDTTIDTGFCTYNLGKVPETFIFNWEVGEEPDEPYDGLVPPVLEDNLNKYASNPNINQLYRNVQDFRDYSEQTYE